MPSSQRGGATSIGSVPNTFCDLLHATARARAHTHTHTHSKRNNNQICIYGDQIRCQENFYMVDRAPALVKIFAPQTVPPDLLFAVARDTIECPWR